MKVLGIIAEYNPFHNGHQYCIHSLKEQTGASHTAVVMSGHFTQRGEPALFDKWTRAHLALLGGADLVIELPAACGVRSASAFAQNGVFLLEALGAVDFLGFGSECGALAPLQEAAQLLSQNTDILHEKIRSKNAEGKSYPRAREEVLRELFPQLDVQLLKSPNNILGVEYLKALEALHSRIRPAVIARHGADHRDTKLSGGFSSASAIREAYKRSLSGVRQEIPELAEDVFAALPPKCLTAFKAAAPVFSENFDAVLTAILRRMPLPELERVEGAGEGLSLRIKKAANQAASFSEIAALAKSKRYTHTRICRVLIHALLGLDAEICQQSPQYLRILGLNRRGAELLKAAKDRAALPLITKVRPAYEKLSETARRQLETDLLATDLYLLASGKQLAGADFTTSPIALPK